MWDRLDYKTPGDYNYTNDVHIILADVKTDFIT